MTKVSMIMTCERIRDFIERDSYMAALMASEALTDTLRERAQEKYETVPVDNETGGSE